MGSIQEFFFNWYPVFGVIFMAMLLFVSMLTNVILVVGR